MPEKTMEPMSDAQASKLTDKLGRQYGNWWRFKPPLKTNNLLIDRELAQWMIESPYVPPPSAEAIVADLVRYYASLREGITEGIAGTVEVTIIEEYRHLARWPLPRESHTMCNRFIFGERSFYGPEVFRATGTDWGLAQNVYEYYREIGQERKTLTLCQGGGSHVSALAARQIITDLLPFPKITWDAVHNGEYYDRDTLTRSETPLDIEIVRERCAAARALRRRSGFLRHPNHKG